MAASKELPVKPMELHQHWEDCSAIRERLRHEKCLLTWSKPSLVGVPCMINISINYKVLQVLVEFHCPNNDVVKAPTIGVLRVQALVGPKKKMF